MLEQALVHAEASGDPTVRREVIGTLLGQLKNGPTPVGAGIERCEELLASSRSDRLLEAVIKRYLCHLYAMAGRLDEAVAATRESSLVLDELDQRTLSVSRDSAAEVLQLAGDSAGAERELLDRLTYFRDTSFDGVDRRAIDSAYLLAGFYCDEGRWDEAGRFAALYRKEPVTNEYGNGASRLSVESRLAAHAGRIAGGPGDGRACGGGRRDRKPDPAQDARLARPGRGRADRRERGRRRRSPRARHRAQRVERQRRGSRPCARVAPPAPVRVRTARASRRRPCRSGPRRSSPAR